MSLSALNVVSAASESDPAISPYVVGAIALGILMFLLLALITFGAGRDHS